MGVEPTGAWQASSPTTREASDLLDLLVPLQTLGTWAVGQLGQSLDGRIATETGHSHYVTGPEDIRRLHRVRALADAVVVGASTVAIDDPRLTVREVDGENPVRVVLDPNARLQFDRTLFRDGAADTLVVRSAGVRAPPPPRPAEVVYLPSDGPYGFDPHATLRMLRSRGLERVLVEGGGVTVSRFLQAGALDRLHVAVAPLLIGSGRPSLTLDSVATLGQALRPPCRHFQLGRDILFDLDLT